MRYCKAILAYVVYWGLILFICGCGSMTNESMLRGMMYLDQKGWGEPTTYGQTIVDENPRHINYQPVPQSQCSDIPVLDPYTGMYIYRQICQ